MFSYSIIKKYMFSILYFLNILYKSNVTALKIGGKTMTVKIGIVFVLTFIIYAIGVLAYTVRIVGIKTGRIAVAYSVFNILALISRMASVFQQPLLTKTIENNIRSGTTGNLLVIFRYILLVSAAAGVASALLMPTFIKLFKKAVESFSIYRSIPRILIHAFSKSGIEQFKDSLSVPQRKNLSHLKQFRKVPKRLVILNVIASAISSTGSLASLYTGCLNPGLRSTCSVLSPVINGFATIMMYVFIDPYLSMMTDDVIRGECSESDFNRCIVFIVSGLIVGPLLSEIILVPAAKLISLIATAI